MGFYLFIYLVEYDLCIYLDGVDNSQIDDWMILLILFGVFSQSPFDFPRNVGNLKKYKVWILDFSFWSPTYQNIWYTIFFYFAPISQQSNKGLLIFVLKWIRSTCLFRFDLAVQCVLILGKFGENSLEFLIRH